MTIKNTLSSSTYQLYRSEIPANLASRYQSLTDDQLVAVYAYTTNETYNSYKDINYQLRTKNISVNHFEMIQAINSAINAIMKDRSSNIYYRYTPLSNKQINDFYTPGRVASHAFFTSVSEINNNFIDPECNVLIRVIPANKITPAYIADISRFPDEKEYLYPPNTFFKVMKVVDLGGNQFEILLLERPL